MIEWHCILRNIACGLQYSGKWLQMQSRKNAQYKLRIKFLPIDNFRELVEPIYRKMYIILRHISIFKTYQACIFEITIPERI